MQHIQFSYTRLSTCITYHFHIDQPHHISHPPQYRRLTQSDRVCIQLLLEDGSSLNSIAHRLGFHTSTITRELIRGSDSRSEYKSSRARSRSIKRIRSRKLGKGRITNNKVLQDFINIKLTQRKWSPDQIAKLLKQEYPLDTSMHVSHETIYQYIYILPRGELKQTLIDSLRQKRKYRRKKRTPVTEESRGRIEGMLSIHERPEEVADRIVPGHWESDLIAGKRNQSAIATLVERTSRFTIIIPLPQGRGAIEVREAITEAVKELPSHMKQSMTHDRGKELADHRRLTIDSGMTVYFADPRSPWQRGTNENTNGLIRQFFPKGTDFSTVTKEEIEHVQELLNTRPRMTLDYKTPMTVFNEYVALDC